MTARRVRETESNLPQIKSVNNTTSTTKSREELDPLFSKKGVKSLLQETAPVSSHFGSQGNLLAASGQLNSPPRLGRIRSSGKELNDSHATIVKQPLLGGERNDSRNTMNSSKATIKHDIGSSSNLLTSASRSNLASSKSRSIDLLNGNLSGGIKSNTSNSNIQALYKNSLSSEAAQQQPQQPHADTDVALRKLDKTARKLDTRLEKAEDILFKSNIPFLKASSTNLFAPDSPIRKPLVSEEYDLFDPHMNPKPAPVVEPPKGDVILSPVMNPPDSSPNRKPFARRRPSDFMNSIDEMRSNRSSVAKKEQDEEEAQKEKKGSRPALSKSNGDFAKMQEVTARLTDPANYPPAYLAKLEANRQLREQGPPLEKKSTTTKKSKSKQNLSSLSRLNLSESSPFLDRLAQSKASSKNGSMEKVEFTGYAPGFRPLDDKEKEKLRSLRSMNNINFLESEPSSPVHDMKMEAILAATPVQEPKKTQSSFGLFDDLPPPRPIANRI